MLITAKYDGRCAECGKPAPKGSEIDYVDRKAYHPACVKEDEPKPEQFRLADELGWLEYERAIEHCREAVRKAKEL